MLAYLGEECSAMDAGGAFAAYITGNVASNLIGRLISAGIADHLGMAANFYFFAALNLAGARSRDVDLFIGQDLGSAEFVHAYRRNHCLFS